MVYGQLVPALQMLEAPEAHGNMRANAASATASSDGAPPPAARTVYTADGSSDGGGTMPLSLTELEFIAAAVNRHLESALSRSVPASVENDLHASLPAGTAVQQPHDDASDGAQADERVSSKQKASTDADAKPCPARASDSAALPAFDGGAPLARPRAAVPTVPLAGTRFHVATGADSVIVSLPRDLPVDPRLNIALAAAYIAFLLYLGTQAHTLLWAVASSCAIAYLMLPTYFGMRASDSLTIGGARWELRQHVLRGGGLFGGRESRASMSRLVVKGGELRDIVGAQVCLSRHPSACQVPHARAAAHLLLHVHCCAGSAHQSLRVSACCLGCSAIRADQIMRRICVRVTGVLRALKRQPRLGEGFTGVVSTGDGCGSA